MCRALILEFLGWRDQGVSHGSRKLMVELWEAIQGLRDNTSGALCCDFEDRIMAGQGPRWIP